MNIADYRNKKPVCSLSAIKRGECFFYEDNLFVCGASARNKQVEVACLKTGSSRFMRDDAVVYPVKTELRIIDEGL